MSHDDHQSIVEVVRNAAREVADGAELLRLTQLFFERFASQRRVALLSDLGEVDRQKIEPPIGIARDDEIHANPEPLPVLGEHDPSYW